MVIIVDSKIKEKKKRKNVLNNIKEIHKYFISNNTYLTNARCNIKHYSKKKYNKIKKQKIATNKIPLIYSLLRYIR